jgi:hypothetical protein
MWETLLVVAGAFGATLLAIYVNNIVFKPVLLVDESSIEKMYDPTTGLWVHKLKVRNVGLKAATNCTVTMSVKGIRKEDVEDVDLIWNLEEGSSTLMRRDSFTDMPTDLDEDNVPWSILAREENWAITINKGAISRVNLFFIRANPNVVQSTLLLASLSKSNWKIGLRAHRDYEGEIKITASNANPRTVKFVIHRAENDIEFKILAIDPQSGGRLLRQLLPRQ